ncbi:helix-turn-helix domain-containing protein [Streptomyces sp. NPDC057638]|uniref:helix-turn-helix domain-containing protein n=1 Tax=Streptomyces sp. NPDC057638 TaxID=3346190 RepID=UPI00368D38A3
MEHRELRRHDYALTVPDALLHSGAMQRACSIRDFQEILRLVNRRTGSSYTVIATAVGMSTSRVGDIIRGSRGVRSERVIERIADGFGIPGHMLGLSARPWEEGPVPDSSRIESARYSAGNSRPLDLMTVAELRQRVQELDERYVSEPSTALIAPVGEHLGKLADWRSLTVKHQVRRDVCAARAKACTLMGQLVWDASGRTDHGTARAYFTQAASAARELNDPVAEGLALLRTSFVSLYGENDPQTGLELASRTAATAKGASHVLAGLATLHVAEAHAILNQRRECEASLVLAERYLTQAADLDIAASLLSPGQFGRLKGSCFLFLNDAPKAEEVLAENVREMRHGSKSHAIALANLALSRIRQRKLDEAIGALNDAIGIVERHRGGGGLKLVFQAGRELRPWHRRGEVRELHDRLMGLISAA